MKLNARAMMRSNPDFDLNAVLEPLGFSLGATGAAAGRIGEVTADIGKVPLDVAIPFLKRRRMVRVASIGGFRIRIHPLEIHLQKVAVEVAGTLGTEGLRAHMHGKVGCKTEMSVQGKLSGEGMNISFAPEKQEEPWEESRLDIVVHEER